MGVRENCFVHTPLAFTSDYAVSDVPVNHNLKNIHVPTVMPYGRTPQGISPRPERRRGKPLRKARVSRFPLTLIFYEDVFVLVQPHGTT